MSKTTSFRRSLLTNLVAAVLVLGLAIVTMMVLSTRRAVESLSATLIDQASRRTEVKLRGLFEPVSRQAASVRNWGVNGLLDVDDPDRMRVLLKPFLREFLWTDAVFIADDRGHEYLLQFIDGRWRDRQIRPSEWGDLERTRRWTDDQATAVESESETDYDPRTRPWFASAVELWEESGDDPAAPLVHWTEPYTFFSTGVPGVTASTAFDCGGRTCVVGLDMALEEITRFTGGIRIFDEGSVFVLSEDGRFVGVPRALDPARRDQDPTDHLLKTPEELGTVAARDASRRLVNDRANWDQAIRLVSAGEPWWGQISPYELPSGRVFLIGVAVPEEDILGSLANQRIWVAAITLVVLGLAIWRAAAMARGYSRPVEKLVEESERISTGDLEPGPPIKTRVEEIRQLAQAHDKMRSGLQTLIKLESDLRTARKIQQQTWPQTLPQLEGFELAAWSEPADETGGDSYDVIGLVDGEGGVELTDGDADRAILLLADATGHGIGPALSVTQLRAMLRMAVRLTPNLADIVGQINDQLVSDLPSGRFITAWLGHLDTTGHTLTTFSAAQAPLILYRAAEDRFELPDANAMPFGLFPGMKTETTGPIELAPSDIYAVVSDGIFEAAESGNEDEQMGTDRVCDVIRRHRDDPLEDVLDRIREATDAFTGGAPFEDDRTIVLIRRAQA